MRYLLFITILLAGCRLFFKTPIDTQIEKSTVDSILTIIYDHKIPDKVSDSISILVWDAYSNPLGFDTVHSQYLKNRKSDTRFKTIWEGCRNNSEYFEYVLTDILSNHNLIGYSERIYDIDSSIYETTQTKGFKIDLQDSIKVDFQVESYIDLINLNLKNRNQIIIPSYNSYLFIIGLINKDEFIKLMRRCGLEL